MANSKTLMLAAIVGLNLAKKAILMMSVNPKLNGIIFSSKVGSGKSSLIESLKRFSGNEKRTYSLPLNIDKNNLIGGLDFEKTLSLYKRVFKPGLLSKANGGILICENLNLLSPEIINCLFGVLDTKLLNIESTGMSQIVTSDFRFIGSYNPDEGVPRKHLLDRIALLVHLKSNTSSELRKKVIMNNLIKEDKASQLQFYDEDRIMLKLVKEARKLLSKILPTPSQIKKIVETAMYCRIEGSRAEIFAIEAARASAALCLRENIEDEDIQLALKCTIFPRSNISEEELTQLLANQNHHANEDIQQVPEQAISQEYTNEIETSINGEDPVESKDLNDSCDLNTNKNPLDFEDVEKLLNQKIQDIVFDSEEVILPKDIINLSAFGHIKTTSRTGSHGQVVSTRGHHIRSVQGNPINTSLDIIATLRAAAPWQNLRNKKTGHLSILKEDLHIKQFSSKAGSLFIFLVDSSGSMAVNRMRKAKGTVIKLLENAYISRDQVALISCRGLQGEIILDPTPSVELAKRKLDILPTGDATPLASSLSLVFDVLKTARHIKINHYVLVLMTDGNFNVGIHHQDKDKIREEVQILCGSIVKQGVQSIVVNTRKGFLRKDSANQLCQWLHGSYFELDSKVDNYLAERIKQAVH